MMVLMGYIFFALKIVKLEEKKKKLVGERIYKEGSCHWSI